MDKKHRSLTPVNIICGHLGAGKTTVLNHLLRKRPKNEYWAVLVNEYGLVGIDAALVEGALDTKAQPGVKIQEVAGGCICCSAGFMFQVSLVKLLQKKPDRLLIEPTGLAALSGILDTLSRDGIKESVDVRSVLCLLDPRHFQTSIKVPTTWDQVEAADVLIASKADLAPPEKLEEFYLWAHGLFPPRSHVGKAIKGELSVDLLDLVRARPDALKRGGHAHGTDHHHDGSHIHEHGAESEHIDESGEATLSVRNPVIFRQHTSSDVSSIGWIFDAGLVFHAQKLSELLDDLWHSDGVIRLKAVFRTNEGWWRFNYVFGDEAFQRSSYRRDSRLEMLINTDAVPCTKTIQQGLLACTIEEILPGL